MPSFRVLFVIVLVMAVVIVIASFVQNEGCLPWQEPVGTQGRPFSGTEDNIKCR